MGIKKDAIGVNYGQIPDNLTQTFFAPNFLFVLYHLRMLQKEDLKEKLVTMWLKSFVSSSNLDLLH